MRVSAQKVVFSAFLILGFLALLLFLHPKEKAQADLSENKPNILLIVTDDQRDGMMQVMPKTRAIFKKGTNYTKGMVTTPQCCPSRSTIFTGQYIHNHEVRSNKLTDNFNHNNTFQRMLDTNGYYTGLFGKYLNGYPKNRPLPYFDESWVSKGRGYLSPYAASMQDYHLTDKASTFLNTAEADDDTPWALTLTYRSPHLPLTPSRRHKYDPVPKWKKTASQKAGVSLKGKNPQLHNLDMIKRGHKDHTLIRRGQYRMLMDVDDNIGRIWNQMQRQGEAEDTLVIFLSDNGYYWGDFGLAGKYLPYLASMQVPFYARYPDYIAEGVKSKNLVANVDVAPTIIEAAGLEADYPVDGRSLISGEPRDWLLLEGAAFSNKEQLPNWKQAYYDGTNYYFKWANGFEEYYNLRKDREQLRNLITLGKKRKKASMNLNGIQLKQFRAILNQAKTCVAITCP